MEPWNKGHTKKTHPSVLKISQTMKEKKIDNFSAWREKARKEGILPTYHQLTQNEDLAFVTGLILGDGNIHQFSRTQCLKIVLGTDKPKLIDYTVKKIEKVFRKVPKVYKRKSKCVAVTLYQKNISERLEIPKEARGNLFFTIPDWIWKNDKYLISYLRGLYEAEGSFCIHKGTYTYKMLFSNKNDSLLNNVYESLVKLGFHPHRSRYQIQVSKKHEVFKLRDLLQFRIY